MKLKKNTDRLQYIAPWCEIIATEKVSGILLGSGDKPTTETNDPYAVRVDGNENGGISIPRPFDDKNDNIEDYKFQK